LLHGRHVPACVYCFDLTRTERAQPPRAASRLPTPTP
jgi:hypothetical protein